MKKPFKLNLGCGSNKIEGFVNVDSEESCKPDLIHDFMKAGIPAKSGAVDEIVFFHCIEHIRKAQHKFLLKDMWRVLKPGGTLILSYPEFTRCYKNWKQNYRGLREFWEATLFGRQLYPSDYHVCIMHTPDFIEMLRDCGFGSITTNPEPQESYNTVVHAVKGPRPANYEDLVKADMTNITFKR